MINFSHSYQTLSPHMLRNVDRLVYFAVWKHILLAAISTHIRVSFPLSHSGTEIQSNKCDFNILNERFLCLHKVSLIVFCLESALEKQCAGKGVNVASRSVIQKINICTFSVWSVCIKDISLSYPSLPQSVQYTLGALKA